MDYYVMEQGLSILHGVVEEPETVKRFFFKVGEWIDPATVPAWTFRVDNDDQHPPAALIGIGVPLLSERLIALLAEAGVDNFQAFPVTLRNEAGTVWTTHRAFNALGVVDAVDVAASEGDQISTAPDGQPGIIRFRRMVLKRKEDWPKLFRVHHYRVPLILRGDLVAHIVAHKPPGGWGLTFNKVEQA